MTSTKGNTPKPVQKKENPRLEKVRDIADINAASFVRVLRNWLKDSPADRH